MVSHREVDVAGSLRGVGVALEEVDVVLEEAVVEGSEVADDDVFCHLLHIASHCIQPHIYS